MLESLSEGMSGSIVRRVLDDVEPDIDGSETPPPESVVVGVVESSR